MPEDKAFWMTARYDSKCFECETDIFEDDRIVFVPEEHKAYCKECGIDICGEDPRPNAS